jgi:hypothetical protein
MKTGHNIGRFSGFRGGFSSSDIFMNYCTLQINKFAPAFQRDGLPSFSGSLPLVHHSPEPNSDTLGMAVAHFFETSASNCYPTRFYKLRKISLVSMVPCRQKRGKKRAGLYPKWMGLPACSLLQIKFKKHRFCRQMISEVLRDLYFSRNQPLKSADD